MNTHFDLERERGADHMATASGLELWLARRGLAASPVAIDERRRARAIAVREGLRAVLAAHNGARLDPAALAGLKAAAEGLHAGTAVGANGRTTPVPTSADLEGALGLILAVVGEAQASGSWGRLKACPGEQCGWAFFDGSRNQASTWCSMRLCGGRQKSRAYRRRSLA